MSFVATRCCATATTTLRRSRSAPGPSLTQLQNQNQSITSHLARRLRFISTTKPTASSSSAPPTSASGKPIPTPEQRKAATRKANEVMKAYADARKLAQQGKIKSKRPKNESSASKSYLILFVTLGTAFVSIPFVCRKVAKDPEFRDNYFPKWLNFAVKKPKESGLTRESMHQDMLRLERDLRERAAKGEFSPENLARIRQELSVDDVATARKYGWEGTDMIKDDDTEDREDDEE